MSESQEKSVLPKGNFNLEMLIAFCAVLISVASFYATFLQANAAEKQVTAMTLPLMSFQTSNIEKETKAPVISLTIANKGVGPAKIETFLLKYNNRFYKTPHELIKSCCNAEWKTFVEQATNKQYQDLPLMITSAPQQQILPSGAEINIMQLYKHPITEPLWNAINTNRFDTSIAVCYCSLLDNCYWLTGRNQITDTPSCKE